MVYCLSSKRFSTKALCNKQWYIHLSKIGWKITCSKSWIIVGQVLRLMIVVFLLSESQRGHRPLFQTHAEVWVWAGRNLLVNNGAVSCISWEKLLEKTRDWRCAHFIDSFQNSNYLPHGWPVLLIILHTPTGNLAGSSQVFHIGITL